MEIVKIRETSPNLCSCKASAVALTSLEASYKDTAYHNRIHAAEAGAWLSLGTWYAPTGAIWTNRPPLKGIEVKNFILKFDFS